MALSLSRRAPATPRWILWLTWLVYRRPKFRPIWDANLVSNDLLGQAEFLHEAGYQVAASMLCRVYLEKALKRLALISPKWRECRAKTNANVVAFLLSNGIVDKKAANLADNVYAHASKVCHSGVTNRGRSWSILTDTKVLRASIEAATVVCLGRTDE